MNVFLLAAGEGLRFRPYTEKMPKPAIPFCGVPLLYYSTFLIKNLNIKKVIINTFHLPEEIHRVGEALKASGVEVYFSDESPNLLGSGGGIANARQFLETSNIDDEIGFLTMNADEVIIPKIENILTDFYHFSKLSTNLSTLLVMKHPEAGKKFGAVWVNQQGKVKGFGKIPPQSKENLMPYHFIGPIYFKNKIFSYLKTEPSNILHDNLNYAISMGESIGIYPIECDWFEIGNLQDYLSATKSFLQLLDTDHPFINHWKQAFLTDWLLVKSSQAIILKHRSARLDNFINVEGFAVFGPNCKIASNVQIKDIVCSHNISLIESEKKYQCDLFL